MSWFMMQKEWKSNSLALLTWDEFKELNLLGYSNKFSDLCIKVQRKEIRSKRQLLYWNSSRLASPTSFTLFYLELELQAGLKGDPLLLFEITLQLFKKDQCSENRMRHVQVPKDRSKVKLNMSQEHLTQKMTCISLGCCYMS